MAWPAQETEETQVWAGLAWSGVACCGPAWPGNRIWSIAHSHVLEGRSGRQRTTERGHFCYSRNQLWLRFSWAVALRERACLAAMDLRFRRVLRELGVNTEITRETCQQALAVAGRRLVAEETISRPTRKCARCQSEMTVRKNETVQASVLTLGGWRLLQHTPFMCRHKGCPFVDKRAWYNYVAVDGNIHQWCWRDADDLQYFFVCNKRTRHHRVATPVCATSLFSAPLLRQRNLRARACCGASGRERYCASQGETQNPEGLELLAHCLAPLPSWRSRTGY